MNNILQNIILKTKRNFYTNHHGEHISYFNGSGLEFNEVRQYNIDDDIRHINWKITARTRTPSVNVFFENRQIDIAIIYINNGGLFFGEKQKKKDIALEILTSLSYISTNNKDSLSTLFFDEKSRAFFKSTKNKNQTFINYDVALNLESLNCDVDFEKLESFIHENIKAKSILFFIGDFLKMPNFKFLAKKYEIYCSVIRDRDEEEIDFNGECVIIDTNSTLQKSMNINNDIVKEYNSYMKNFDKELFNHFKENKISFSKFYTNEDTIEKLALFLR